MNLYQWLTLKTFPHKIHYNGKDYFLFLNTIEDNNKKMLWMVSYTKIYSYKESAEKHKNKDYGFAGVENRLSWEHHMICINDSLSKCIKYMKDLLKRTQSHIAQ